MAELDSRREVGIIVRESKVVSGLVKAFEADWERKEVDVRHTRPRHREIKKKLKDDGQEAIAAESPCQGSGQRSGLEGGKREVWIREEMKETVEKAVKEAVRERVAEMLNESEEE